MANIHDYLYWRGDLTMDQVPFGDLDSLVLTRFSYMPFEELSMDSEETIESLCEKLMALPTELFRLESDAKFVSLLKDAKRYNRLPVTDFVKHNDVDAVVQFAAITVYLPDGTLFIAYCGTDSTLVGWKEDFYMSFTQDVPAQLEGLAYAKTMLARYPEKKFYLGGHSKGGNLSMYTAVNLPDDLKERLIGAYDFDGPGFPDDYIQSHDFSSVLERIHSFLPQESMIGRIHNHPEGFSVVESTVSGLSQHDVYSWVVEPTQMKLLEKPDDTSEITYRGIQNILENTSPEQRKLYVDRMFDIMMSTDSDSFTESLKELPRELYKASSTMSPEERKENQEMVITMARSFIDAAVSYEGEKLPEKIPELLPEGLPEKLSEFGNVLEKIQDKLPEYGIRLRPKNTKKENMEADDSELLLNEDA